VGAGPGDPGLITVKGLQRLREAEVVVYDRLANEALLAEAPESALRLYAGKGPEDHTLTQQQINALLVEQGGAGKRVVRLKGGDPFVFGRGGEEAEALVAAGIPFEVVPGVTSAIAAPAYAGVPVTHRDFTPAFAVITGHEDPAKSESAIPWDALAAGPDTLVFLMGVGHIELIAARLVAAGRPATTPVTVVRRGTWPDQQVVRGALSDIAERVRAVGLTPPCVTVVGRVASLASTLAWFHPGGLAGKSVLVTRAREQASSLSLLLESFGARVFEYPAIRIVPAESYDALDAALAQSQAYRWLCFTSVNAVDAVDRRLEAIGRTWRQFAGSRIAAIGPATAQALVAHGAGVDYVPERYLAEAIAEGLPDAHGARVLLARADIADARLVQALEARGAQVDQFVAYRTLVSDADAAELRGLLEAGAIDVVTFASSSTVRNLHTALGPDAAQLLRGTLVACIGPVTAGTAQSLGIEPAIVAEEHTIAGLVSAIQEHLKS
jgi:uroporphyrinogen III methyltransferase/synthase